MIDPKEYLHYRQIICTTAKSCSRCKIQRSANISHYINVMAGKCQERPKIWRSNFMNIFKSFWSPPNITKYCLFNLDCDKWDCGTCSCRKPRLETFLLGRFWGQTSTPQQVCRNTNTVDLDLMLNFFNSKLGMWWRPFTLLACSLMFVQHLGK